LVVHIKGHGQGEKPGVFGFFLNIYIIKLDNFMLWYFYYISIIFGSYTIIMAVIQRVEVVTLKKLLLPR